MLSWCPLNASIAHLSHLSLSCRLAFSAYSVHHFQTKMTFSTPNLQAFPLLSPTQLASGDDDDDVDDGDSDNIVGDDYGDIDMGDDIE